MEESKKKEQIINTYQELLEANIKYLEYLNSFGEKNDLDEKSINLLKVGYATFALLLWKDEIIKKDSEYNLSTTVVEEILDEHINIITNKKNIWSIGEIEFTSSLDLLNVLRNKLAHGDYQIKENEIILEINDKIGSVNIDRLLDLTIQLDQNLSLIQKQKENTVGMIRNKNALENINIKTKSDLDKALSNMSYVEIKEKPRKLCLRTKEYIALAINLKKVVKTSIQNLRKVDNLTSVPKLKFLLEQVNMDAKVTETMSTDLEATEKARKMYVSRINEMRAISPIMQQKYLAFWLQEAIKKEMQKKSISFGIVNNEVLLKELKKNPNRNLINIIEQNKFGPLLIVENEKTVLTAYLINFYFTYIYALDNILNEKNKEDIRDIVENKAFDFSKLDLSGIKNQMDIETKNFSNFEGQTNKLDSDILNLDTRIYKLQNIIDSLKNVIVSHPERKEVLDKNILIQEEALLKRDYIIGLKERVKKYYEEDLTRYKKNRAIIEHIRNSIAHGNISLNIFNENYTLEDALLTFNDEHDGKTTTIQLTLKEFETLFSNENIKTILDFINPQEDINSLKK